MNVFIHSLFSFKESANSSFVKASSIFPDFIKMALLRFSLKHVHVLPKTCKWFFKKTYMFLKRILFLYPIETYSFLFFLLRLFFGFPLPSCL